MSNEESSVLSVQLSDPVRSSNVLYVPYAVASLPTVGYLVPTTVPRATGGVVTVYGSGFAADHRCLFHPAPVTADIVVESPSVISCVVPPSEALGGLSVYRLQVVNSSGYAHPTDIADAVNVTFIEAPSIVSYAPTFMEVAPFTSKLNCKLTILNVFNIFNISNLCMFASALKTVRIEGVRAGRSLWI